MASLFISLLYCYHRSDSVDKIYMKLNAPVLIQDPKTMVICHCAIVAIVAVIVVSVCLFVYLFVWLFFVREDLHRICDVVLIKKWCILFRFCR